MSNKVLVIGAQNIDLFTKTDTPYTLRDSNSCSVSLSFGGVARNIVGNLARLQNDVSFITVFSTDHFGKMAKQSLLDLGVDISHSKEVEGYSNSIYLGILDEENDLYLGLNDMDIVNTLSKDYLQNHMAFINTFDFVVIDNNLSLESISYLLKNVQGKVIMDAVSAHKLPKIADVLSYIDYLKVNKLEHYTLVKRYEDVTEMDIPGTLNILVTNGEQKIQLLTEQKPFYTMPIPCDNIVNASGAGDGFLSGFVHGLLQGKDEVTCLEYAKKVAYITIQSNDATNDKLHPSEVENETIYGI